MQLFWCSIFLFFFSICAPAQNGLREVNLLINNVGSGTPYSKVIQKFGRPIRSKIEKTGSSLSCSGSAETYLTLFYSGLEISLLGDGAGKALKTVSIEVTSRKWSASGVSIGQAPKTVIASFGKPISTSRLSGEVVFYYITPGNLGGVNFYFRNNKLAKIAMTETLC